MWGVVQVQISWLRAHQQEFFKVVYIRVSSLTLMIISYSHRMNIWFAVEIGENQENKEAFNVSGVCFAN